MFSKAATIFGVFAVAAQVAVATPPACLIGAVNTQSNPGDVKRVCKDGAAEVQKYLSSNCGNMLDTANSAFSSYCKDAGVTVSTSASSSVSGSTSKSSDSSSASETSQSNSGTLTTDSAPGPKGTQTGGMPAGTAGTAASSGFMTTPTNAGTSTAPTDSANGSPSGSGSDSGSASGSSSAPSASPSDFTGAASRLGMDIVGLAAVAMFGAMMAL